MCLWLHDVASEKNVKQSKLSGKSIAKDILEFYSSALVIIHSIIVYHFIIELLTVQQSFHWLCNANKLWETSDFMGI